VTQTLTADGGLLRGLAFSGDGKLLAAVALGGTQPVRVWDLATGKVKQTLEGAASAGFVSLAFAPDGKTLVLAGGGTEVQRWDLAGGKALAAFTGNARRTNAITFSHDGKLMLCAGWGPEGTGGEIVVLRADTGEKVQTVPNTSASAFAAGKAVWAIALQDRGVEVWTTGGE
jgi:WD40 repeat protein